MNSRTGTFSQAWDDLAAALGMWRIWLFLGWRDFRYQTNRTLLGLLWPIIGLALTVGALGYVYGALLSWPANTGYPYIAAGFVCWFFISGCVQGGLNIFIANAGLLKERPLPVSFSIFRYTARMFFEFVIKFIVFFGAAALVKLQPNFNMLLVVPGLIIYFLNGLWINLLFGIAGARFRDLQELFSPLMLIAFLSTPVLWPKSAMGDRAFITQYNPFSQFIDVIREPLLGFPIPTSALIFTCTFLLVGWIVTFIVFSKCRSKLVFWL